MSESEQLLRELVSANRERRHAQASGNYALIQLAETRLNQAWKAARAFTDRMAIFEGIVAKRTGATHE